MRRSDDQAGPRHGQQQLFDVRAVSPNPRTIGHGSVSLDDIVEVSLPSGKEKTLEIEPRKDHSDG